MKLTIDTNVFWDAFGPNRTPPEQTIAQQLFALEAQGLCDLALTSKWAVDVPGGDAREALSKQPIAAKPMVPCIGIWDEAVWDVDVCDGGEHEQVLDDVFSIIFPNAERTSNASQSRIRDVGHLVGHWLSGRDAFVSRDTKWEALDELRAKYGLVVYSPAEAVALLQTNAP